MRMVWVDYPYSDKGGDTLGYSGMIRRLRPALERAGVQFVSERSMLQETIALHVCSPGVFGQTAKSRPWVKARRRGVRNILFTMWESADSIVGQRGNEMANCSRADLIVTPNGWCSELFGTRTGKPVATVPLACDPIPYRERSMPEGGFTAERPFKWLLVGAFNPRKGIPQLVGAWQDYFAENTAMRLLIKSTFPLDVIARLEETGEAPVVVSRRNDPRCPANLVQDSRLVARAELEAMYDEADAFILPTMGEGWSLPTQEAMTAGLPVLATACQGINEYADPSNAALMPWHWQAVGSRDAKLRSDAPDGKFRYCYVPPNTVAAAMIEVMTNYEQAIARARKAAWDARQFTWERTAGSLIAAIGQHAIMAAA
jgi:glycosyltransferase involved in cell wall biosynthesis